MSGLVRMPGEENPRGPVFLSLGFRPFFLVAGMFAVLTILLWAAQLFGVWHPSANRLEPGQWHAHEMLFGYGMAVIAGFLLTAVRNWTNITTINGYRLLGLVLLWLVARALFVVMPTSAWTALADGLFMLGLFVAVGRPLWQARQWRQAGVLLKLALLLVCNVMFYLGATGRVEQGVTLGLYGGLYLMLGLILVMGRRLTPFFIERGVGYPVILRNSVTVDMAGLVVYIGFFVSEVLLVNRNWGAVFACMVFVLNAYRLSGWHSPGIWRKSLLWSLYLAQWLVATGFLLLALAYWNDLTRSPAIHAMAYGGIGMVTLAMMCRVSLGHTGRNVAQPPAAVAYLAMLLAGGALVRVLGPWLAPQWYLGWIGIAQLTWVLTFMGFLATYFRILTGPEQGR